nr:hypothetical protein [Sphingomonas sp. Leaf5]
MGCGSGWPVATTLAAAGHRVAGIDPSPHAARRLSPCAAPRRCRVRGDREQLLLRPQIRCGGRDRAVVPPPRTGAGGFDRAGRTDPETGWPLPVRRTPHRLYVARHADRSDVAIAGRNRLSRAAG